MLPATWQHRLPACDRVCHRLSVDDRQLWRAIGRSRSEQLLWVATLGASLAGHQLPQRVQPPAAGLTHPPALGHAKGNNVVPGARGAALLCQELAGAALKGCHLLKLRAHACKRVLWMRGRAVGCCFRIEADKKLIQRVEGQTHAHASISPSHQQPPSNPLLTHHSPPSL